MSDSICYTIQINIFINIKIKRTFYVQYVILTCIIIEYRKIHVHSIYMKYKSKKYIGLLVRF